MWLLCDELPYFEVLCTITKGLIKTMFDILLTLAQAFQMMTLAPCILVIAYLFATCDKFSSVLVPIIYLLSLSCGLLIPLLPAFFPNLDPHSIVYFVLRLGESFGTAISYLFILQLIFGKYPDFVQHLILAVPAVGGSSFIYLSQVSSEIPIGLVTIPSSYVPVFYNIFSSAFIFMLLILYVGRSFKGLSSGDVQKKYKYWLIISLIVINLLLLMLDLWKITYHNQDRDSIYVFAQSTIRLGFIYIVLTSMFRVFTDIFYDKAPTVPFKKVSLTEKEIEISKHIEELMVKDKLYTDLNFSRTMLASLLQVKEHQLSTIISLAFKKSFTEFINYYRIEEAKRLLKENDQPITVISFDTGFNNLTSFNRVFKEVTGLSPSQFRAQ